jgi:hypothetical protein
LPKPNNNNTIWKLAKLTNGSKKSKRKLENTLR